MKENNTNEKSYHALNHVKNKCKLIIKCPFLNFNFCIRFASIVVALSVYESMINHKNASSPQENCMKAPKTYSIMLIIKLHDEKRRKEVSLYTKAKRHEEIGGKLKIKCKGVIHLKECAISV